MISFSTPRGGGKTTWLINQARKAVTQNQTVIFVSMNENASKHVQQRFVLGEGNINFITHTQFSTGLWERGRSRHERRNYFVDDFDNIGVYVAPMNSEMTVTINGEDNRDDWEQLRDLLE